MKFDSVLHSSLSCNHSEKILLNNLYGEMQCFYPHSRTTSISYWWSSLPGAVRIRLSGDLKIIMNLLVIAMLSGDARALAFFLVAFRQFLVVTGTMLATCLLVCTQFILACMQEGAPYAPNKPLNRTTVWQKQPKRKLMSTVDVPACHTSYKPWAPSYCPTHHCITRVNSVNSLSDNEIPL